MSNVSFFRTLQVTEHTHFPFLGGIGSRHIRQRLCIIPQDSRNVPLPMGVFLHTLLVLSNGVRFAHVCFIGVASPPLKAKKRA